MERVVRELESRTSNPDAGWDERDALKHWTQNCGPSAVTRYLHVFLLNEVKLRPVDEVLRWQQGLVRLFSYVLHHGLSMESFQKITFKEALFQSRNAEEALLVAMNACGRITKQISDIKHPDSVSFGAWFKRIQGQLNGNESVLASDCLSFLNLAQSNLIMGDFYKSDFTYSNLQNVDASYACFIEASFFRADLRKSSFNLSRCDKANFCMSDLPQSHLLQANMEGAIVEGANLQEANLSNANLKGAYLQETNLQSTRLYSTNLSHASLGGANLKGASLVEANLEGANLEGANLEGANLEGAQLPKANLKGANLKGANLQGANLKEVDMKNKIYALVDNSEANLEGANLKDTNLEGAKLPEGFKVS